MRGTTFFPPKKIPGKKEPVCRKDLCLHFLLSEALKSGNGDHRHRLSFASPMRSRTRSLILLASFHQPEALCKLQISYYFLSLLISMRRL